MVRRTWSSTLSLGSSKNLNAAVIWFSDYQEYLKLQQNVTQLNEWRKDINTESIENPEWARVITDTNDKVLFGIKQDGSVEWYIGVPKPIRDEQAANKHQPSSFSHHPS